MHSGGVNEKALFEIKWEIPVEILDLVFIKKNYQYRSQPTNLDREIMRKVIVPKVMVDCNLVGGSDYIVPLLDVHRDMTEEFMAVYRVPKSFTDNRSIMSILGVLYINPFMVATPGGNSACGWSSIMASTQAVMDAMSPIPNFSSSEVSLEGENTIIIRDARVLPNRSFARCVLGYDEYMSNINPRSYIAYAHLCLLATKAYIWTNRKVPMDRGEMEGGVTLGSFKEVVDSYEVAAADYKDYLKNTMRKILFMNDDVTKRRHLTRLVGGYK